MKTKSILSIAGALVVLAGATAIVQLRSSPGGSGTTESPLPASREETKTPASSAPLRDTDPQKSQGRGSDKVRFSELIAEYGESRTKLSRHVVGEAAGLIEGMLELRALAEEHSGQSVSFTTTTLEELLGENAAKLDLTEEQEALAADLLGNYEERLIDLLAQLSNHMKENPEPFMDALLAGDARSQGKISEEEYLRKVRENETRQKFIGMDPETLFSMESKDLLEDPAFVGELRQILDPGQQETFDSIAGGQVRENGENNTVMNAVNLETLSNKLGSFRQMLSGARSMLDGARGLELGF